MKQYKVVEVSPNLNAIQTALTTWAGQGWTLDRIHQHPASVVCFLVFVKPSP